jgi:CRP/FNR family transcriptional regulator
MGDDLPDLALLRRACAPCTLKDLCQHARAPLTPDALLPERVHALVRGAVLFRAGEPGTSVHVVRAGALKTVAIAEDGSEYVLGFHLPGEMVGLDALATGRHRAEACALTESHVCEVPLSQLLAAAGHAPELGPLLLQAIGGSAMQGHDHVGLLLRRQAGERIAAFLLDMLERTSGERMATSLRLPMSREDIGGYLNLALETVSRGFSRLQDEGVIEVTGRTIHVRDAARLRSLAQVAGSGDDDPVQRQA